MSKLIQLLACLTLTFLIPGIQSSRNSIINPVVLTSTNFGLQLLENDVLQINVSVHQKSFKLEMMKSKAFFVEALDFKGFDYFDGFAFEGGMRVGSAFGEYRAEINVFVGEFQDENTVYYIDEDSNGIFLYKLSDQPNIDTAMTDNSMPTHDELLLPLPYLRSHPNNESTSVVDNGHICNMKVTVDNTLAQAMKYDTQKILSTVKRLIHATNVIFKENDIKVKEHHLHFIIENILIADQSICSNSSSTVFYCNNSITDPKSYLIGQAMEETSGRYCLSYALTNQKFGKIQGATFNGGICSRYNLNNKQGYNTGFVIIEDPETSLSSSEFALTHLISHSLGVDHDDDQCGSGFLMESNARKTRNFSTCTKQKMNTALTGLLTHSRRDCFKDESFFIQNAEEGTRRKRQSERNRAANEICAGVAQNPHNYLVPHPSDCTKFYSCQSLGWTGGWIAHPMNCPATTGFDVNLRNCNYIQAVPRCRERDPKSQQWKPQLGEPVNEKLQLKPQPVTSGPTTHETLDISSFACI